MSDIEAAKALLDDKIRCVIFSGDYTFTSDKRGIAPLMEVIAGGKDMRGCIAADRIVGKAAAFLYVKMGAAEVYAETISEAAIAVLDRYGIKFGYGTAAKFIRNRSGDDICPMEKTVADISEPEAAYIALKAKIDEMRAGAVDKTAKIC